MTHIVTRPHSYNGMRMVSCKPLPVHARRAYIPFLLAVKTIYPQRACKGTAFFRHKQKKVQYFIKYCTLVPIFQKSLNSVESFSFALPLSHILFTPSFTHSLHSSTPHSTNSLFHLSNNSHSYAYHVPFHMFFSQKEHAILHTYFLYNSYTLSTMFPFPTFLQ